ncbi:tyrosine-type recombinase/integrase [soil metagenome]
MTGDCAVLVENYLAMRRGLGYRLERQARYLRNFAGFLDRAGHHGPVPLMLSVDWATSTSSTDPCNRARRLSVLRGFLRHLAALDGATEVPPPGLLGPTGRRKPPHVYSDGEITSLLRAAAALTPAGGLRPHCYVTLFSLLACTGLRISEALALSREDVDLAHGVLTVRAGKGGRARLVPLHPSALEPLRGYAARRDQYGGAPADAFFRTDRGDRLSYQAVSNTFSRMRRRLGWTAQGRTRAPRIHDLRHRMVVRRLQLWHAQGADVDRKIAALATYLGHVVVSDVYWYLTAVPELMTVVAGRFEAFAQRREAGAS